ncbi:hypothetical protein WEH80_00580 [Actinomycetes bacterium KLBMP 9759]
MARRLVVLAWLLGLAAVVAGIFVTASARTFAQGPPDKPMTVLRHGDPAGTCRFLDGKMQPGQTCVTSRNGVETGRTTYDQALAYENARIARYNQYGTFEPDTDPRVQNVRLGGIALLALGVITTTLAIRAYADPDA